MNQIEVKFGDWIQRGFDLYKSNFMVLAPAGLLAMVVAMVSFGILAGPLMAGLIMITLALHDKTQPAPQIGDVFKGFSLFLPTFLYCLGLSVVMFVGLFILGLIPCLGQVAGILFVYGLNAVVMFTLFNIVDKKMELMPAVQASIEVVKSNFWPFLGFSLVAAILGSLGVLACGIGAGLTMPLYLCIVGVAYRDLASAPVPPPVG